MARERGNYSSHNRISRRGALRGAGLGVAGLAGVALFGCGGDDGEGGGGTTATAASGGTGTAAAGGGALPSDQIRIAPGAYENSIPPTPGELDPANNARYGGTLMARSARRSSARAAQWQGRRRNPSRATPPGRQNSVSATNWR